MLSAEEAKREVYYLYNIIRNEDTIRYTYAQSTINSVTKSLGYAIPMIVLLTFTPVNPVQPPCPLW